MLQPGQSADLPLEPLDADRLAQRGVQHLERDPPAVTEVLGEVDRRAAAPAQLLLDPVAVRQVGGEEILAVGQPPEFCMGRGESRARARPDQLALSR